MWLEVSILNVTEMKGKVQPPKMARKLASLELSHAAASAATLSSIKEYDGGGLHIRTTHRVDITENSSVQFPTCIFNFGPFRPFGQLWAVREYFSILLKYPTLEGFFHVFICFVLKQFISVPTFIHQFKLLHVTIHHLCQAQGQKSIYFLHSIVRTENLVNVKVTKNILFLFEVYFLGSK